MAKNQGLGQTSEQKSAVFNKGLNKDSDPTYIQEGMWTHARNVVNNTVEGDMGSISNEASNILCAEAGKTMPCVGVNAAVYKYIIGAIHLFSDKWVIYTAGHGPLSGSSGVSKPVMSEIGLLETDTCTYRPIVQDRCLGFDKHYLVSGASREKEDCSWQIYWADGLNPDRSMNIGDPKLWPGSNYIWTLYTLNCNTTSYSQFVNQYTDGTSTIFRWPGVAWIQICPENFLQVPINSAKRDLDCEVCRDTNGLNCSQIRLARFMKTPCVRLSPGNYGGSLRNGSYFAVIAYTIKGIKVTDYFSPSNVQPLYNERDETSSLVINIDVDNTSFDEFELVLIQTVNEGAVAKRIGIYSTDTTVIPIDQIKVDLLTIPLGLIPIVTPVYEKSDQMTEVNNYLLRVGPTSKFDFNYQPLANLIKVRWASVEYPGDYYIKGGYKPTYMRDEVYSFFIRWIYDTGDKSASYHIPGRAPKVYTPVGVNEVTPVSSININWVKDNALATDDKFFEIQNTAAIFSGYPVNSIPGVINNTLNDGGRVLVAGEMGYWESTEYYPNNRPDIWNSSFYNWSSTGSSTSNVDLCGVHIRHHKFPENALDNDVVHFQPGPDTGNSATIATTPKIRLLGVFFEDIVIPKDNDGNDITNIVGYEILRGSREGNRTVIAKGLINNYKSFEVIGPVQTNLNKQGLYLNHPFNTITTQYGSANPVDFNYEQNDPYFKIPNDATSNIQDKVNQYHPLDVTSFHSPDTMFRFIYLNSNEFKLDGYLRGYTNQYFQEPDKHPKFKLLTNGAMYIAILVGIGEGILGLVGKIVLGAPGASYTAQFGPKIKPRSGGTSGIPSNLPGTEVTNLVVTAGLTTGTSVVNLTHTEDGGGDTATDTGEELTTPADKTTSKNETGDPSGTPVSPTSFFGKLKNYFSLGTIFTNGIAGNSGIANIYDDFNYGTGYNKGGTFTAPQTDRELTAFDYLPGWLQGAYIATAGIGKFQYYFSQGGNTALNVIYAAMPYRQYAMQMIGHGLYDRWTANNGQTNLKRFNLADAIYVQDNIADIPSYTTMFGNEQRYVINNLKRSDHVVLRTTAGPLFTTPPPQALPGALVNTGPNLLFGLDQSLVTIGQLGITSNPTRPFSKKIASHYGALKIRLRNQYGQLGGIKQLAITECEQQLNDGLNNVIVIQNATALLTQKNGVKRSPIFFYGDTYINRFTEKNTMFMFYDWLYGQPDGYEYNYYLRPMISNPRFWVNNITYEIGALLDFTNLVNPQPDLGNVPRAFYDLDNVNWNYSNDTEGNYPGILSVKESYFYLSTSAVRDFYVESDVIVDFRQNASEAEFDKHYDPYRYTDLNTMFNMNPQIIARPNVYRYDYSLSIFKLITNFFSAGSLQSPYYDPDVAELCYVYYPDRIIYSLPQQDEALKDSWFVYLTNNYKEFKSQISNVKSFAKSGIFITFKNDSPVTYQGVDVLTTDLNTKITIGDGGLFSQPSQNITVADKPFEYGSSQNRLSVLSSPAGLYYISQNQGKIFSYADGLKEISQIGMKWWFNIFLPYRLLNDFPEYPWVDNPVAGIGCQTLYDNENSVLYFAKKDYKLKVARNLIAYDANADNFYYVSNPLRRFLLGDPLLFENASWTISFDPKLQFFISFHDWHPDLSITTKTNYLTTKGSQVWKHDATCQSYCNFYGIQYPFEIEIPVITGQTVTTIKSLEYVLECYRRNIDCVDQFHVLDFNFDQLVLHNSEQATGYLHLNPFPKNNVTLSLDYPKQTSSIDIDPSVTPVPGYDILFSKEENKYRINQFWDITYNRGEFPQGAGYPPTGPLIPNTTVLQGTYIQNLIWNTQSNGYIRLLNQTNLDYNKPLLQRKKLRHYLNFINLSRRDSSNVNMILKIVNSKNQFSPR